MKISKYLGKNNLPILQIVKWNHLIRPTFFMLVDFRSHIEE